jgi:hypothetical protein
VGHSFRMLAAVASTIVPFSCGQGANSSNAASLPQAGVLPAGVVARIGVVQVSSEAVLATSSVQGLSIRDALGREIGDAVWAVGALGRGLDGSAAVRCAVRSRLARALLAEMKVKATSTPPSDAEIAELTALHFLEMDRPEAFRTIHALVRVSDSDRKDVAARARARNLADRVKDAVAVAKTADEFQAQARSVDCSPFELTVEELDPVAEDGRVVKPQDPKNNDRYTAEYARAAARLTETGQKSDVVETDFGFHVLMLLERQPELRMPLEERRRTLAGEVSSRRAQASVGELIQGLRASTRPAVERSADAYLRTLVIPAP